MDFLHDGLGGRGDGASVYRPDQGAIESPERECCGAGSHSSGGAGLQEQAALPGKKHSWAETWASAKSLLGQRMFVGIYMAQFCISTLTFFFLTWFPVYLVQQRGLSLLNAGLLAAIPAIFGFIGGISGGLVSDWMLRKGISLTMSRKLPIFIGMALSMSMILCNYVQTDVWVVVFMAVAFFGKGMGALGWAIIADVSPKHSAGMNGALFNTFGSIAGIVTPVVIGYMVQSMGSFNGALIYVALNAAGAFVCYLFVVGPLKRPDEQDPLKIDAPILAASYPAQRGLQ